ncbi:hypothetical protein GLOIN_2v1790829 [Rhizophagus irregularis DAOM 181602=DAOM 197198]|nr:hypothetical protein GLOIN_2v1790829 [Rhizophagus irregularis DAOM 181602=DAOM 197198]
MLKHLGPSASALLFNLICACLSDANIPDLWRQATVFPIPKPHEWKCQLENTRLITLLEVIRKALVKLFYNRLAPLLASHHVLQGDPLLTALKNEMKDSYCLVSPMASDIVSSNSCSLDVLEINNLVFMDDSTLISSSKERMEHMLSITEEFYCLNNTSANHNKYVLATNAVTVSRDLSPVTFNLRTSSLNITSNITVTFIPMSSFFCFLGVWFNINGSRNFIR